MSTVFLTYTDKDAALAKEVDAQFRRHGIATTEDGPAVGQVVVVIFSEATNGDANVVKEIQAAQELGLRIFGLRTEAVFPSTEFDSSSTPIQWVNAIAGSMDGHIGRLVGQVSGDSAMRVETPVPSVAPVVEVPMPPVVRASPPVNTGSYCVKLLNAGPRVLEVIAEIRSITGLGLMEAKNMAEMTPVAIYVTEDREVAESIRLRLMRDGGLAIVEAVDAPTAPPVLAAPTDLYDVRLLSANENPLNVIKEVRLITGWELMASKNFVDAAPQTIARVGMMEANAIRQRLENAGATASMDIASPYTEPNRSFALVRPAPAGCATSMLSVIGLALFVIVLISRL